MNRIVFNFFRMCCVSLGVKSESQAASIYFNNFSLKTSQILKKNKVSYPLNFLKLSNSSRCLKKMTSTENVLINEKTRFQALMIGSSATLLVALYCFRHEVRKFSEDKIEIGVDFLSDLFVESQNSSLSESYQSSQNVARVESIEHGSGIGVQKMEKNDCSEIEQANVTTQFPLAASVDRVESIGHGSGLDVQKMENNDCSEIEQANVTTQFPLTASVDRVESIGHGSGLDVQKMENNDCSEIEQANATTQFPSDGNFIYATRMVHRKCPSIQGIQNNNSNKISDSNTTTRPPSNKEVTFNHSQDLLSKSNLSGGDKPPAESSEPLQSPSDDDEIVSMAAVAGPEISSDDWWTDHTSSTDSVFYRQKSIKQEIVQNNLNDCSEDNDLVKLKIDEPYSKDENLSCDIYKDINEWDEKNQFLFKDLIRVTTRMGFAKSDNVQREVTDAIDKLFKDFSKLKSSSDILSYMIESASLGNAYKTQNDPYGVESDILQLIAEKLCQPGRIKPFNEAVFIKGLICACSVAHKSDPLVKLSEELKYYKPECEDAKLYIQAILPSIIERLETNPLFKKHLNVILQSFIYIKSPLSAFQNLIAMGADVFEKPRDLGENLILKTSAIEDIISTGKNDLDAWHFEVLETLLRSEEKSSKRFEELFNFSCDAMNNLSSQNEFKKMYDAIVKIFSLKYFEKHNNIKIFGDLQQGWLIEFQFGGSDDQKKKIAPSF